MRKIFAIAVFALTLTACGGGASQDNTAADSTQVDATVTVPVDTTAAAGGSLDVVGAPQK